MTRPSFLTMLAVLALFAGCKSNVKTTYQTATIKTGDLASYVTATGTIEPIIQVEVGTQVSGIISNIYVDYNDVVTTGQVLAELDRTTLEANLSSSEANLKAARLEYEYQQTVFLRNKGLYEKGLISDYDFDTYKYQYEKAEASYKKSQSDIIQARTNLGYATIYSPIDGVVLSRAVEEGQTVAASFSTPTLFTIANDLRNMQVIADVDEAEIGQVHEGQTVRFNVDAFLGEDFYGTVAQVRYNPTTTSNVVTYEVVINAPNPDLKLLPGLTANVYIYSMERNDVVLLPLKALRYNPSEAGNQVWIKQDSVIKPVTVQLGESDGIYYEVISGLSAGDQVVLGTQEVTASPSSTIQGTSPFMPQPPGGNRNNGNNNRAEGQEPPQN